MYGAGKYKIGDKVQILVPVRELNHRKSKKLKGKITHINGAYIMVKPMWCSWEMELYPCEIQRA